MPARPPTSEDVLVIVRHIDPLSLAKILGLLYAILGFVFGAFLSLAALAGAFGRGSDGILGVLMGLGAVLFLPLIYGALGLFGGLITALLYNLLSRVGGGVKLELVPDSEAT
jgi:hypothetical protein